MSCTWWSRWPVPSWGGGGPGCWWGWPSWCWGCGGDRPGEGEIFAAFSLREAGRRAEWHVG